MATVSTPQQACMTVYTAVSQLTGRDARSCRQVCAASQAAGGAHGSPATSRGDPADPGRAAVHHATHLLPRAVQGRGRRRRRRRPALRRYRAGHLQQR